MKLFREQPWFQDTDGVYAIYKDPDTILYYEVIVKMKGTSLTAGPTWKSSGVTISDSNYTIANNDLSVVFKVAKTGQATLSYTDNLGNEEAITFKWKYRDR